MELDPPIHPICRQNFPLIYCILDLFISSHLFPDFKYFIVAAGFSLPCLQAMSRLRPTKPPAPQSTSAFQNFNYMDSTSYKQKLQQVRIFFKKTTQLQNVNMYKRE